MQSTAFIFDMDDLLIRSGPVWRAAEMQLLQAVGHPWDAQLAASYKGMNALDVAATIHRALQPPMALEQCQKLIRDALIAGFAGEIEAMPGALALLRRLAGRAPIALASGSPLPAILAALQRLEIRQCFNHVVSSESVARGKPHPDVFLAAAEALGVPPANCLVFEDSLIGVRAARAAAMRCIAVPSGAHDEIRRLATRTFDSLADVPVDDILPPQTIQHGTPASTG
jgi:HAD superfamily hydrolase (TIGR01509 family)